MAESPTVASPGEIYTPPKAFLKGQQSRIAKPPRESRRAASSIFEAQSKDSSRAASTKYASQTMKAKSTRHDKPSITGKSSVHSIFTDTTRSTPASKPTNGASDSSPALLRPRLRGENTLAPSTPPKANSKVKRATATQPDSNVAALKEAPATTSPKSSASLRETIAKAKAAKKKARESAGIAEVPSHDTQAWPTDVVNDDFSQGGSTKGLLRKRTQQAVTSGHLIIAAMNLKQIPTEVMNMYDPENTTASWADMVALTKLNAADNDIEVLDDEMFPSEVPEDDEVPRPFLGLELLDLHRNALRQLPSGLRNLEQLQTLNLSGNKLENDIFETVCQIPNLRELFLAENQIQGTVTLDTPESRKSIYFEHLEVLDLHGNAINGFGGSGLSVLTKLKVLNLAGTKMSSLDWSLIPASTLTELDISSNCFSGSLFKSGNVKFGALRTLDASLNELQSFFDGIEDDSSTFPSLRSLNLSGNKLTNLPSFEGMSSLVTLQVADNKLKEIPTNLAALENLKSIDVGNNDIRLVPAELAAAERLTSLNLVGNPLREKKYLGMDFMELKTDLEKKLDRPQASQGPQGDDMTESIGSAYRYMPVNGTLDLSSQGLTSVPLAEIDLTSEIHTVKLSNNDLATLPVELLSHASVKYSLTSLDLSHNPSLQSSEYLASEIFLPNLKSLYIVSTGLTSLDALTTHLHAPELREVNISCHRLAGHVPWVRAWWPKVTTLLATDNWFSSVDVEGVRGLECLDIRNNEIEQLPPRLGLLGNLPGAKEKVAGRLKVLEVSGNRFRVPRLAIVEKGTEAVLNDLRRMVKDEEVTDEWRDVL
jgi:Leucine-rich repeat (LRR) protein